MGERSLVQQNKSIQREEEDVLVHRCRKGDTDAFARLMRLHEKQIYNYTYRMLGDYAEAEDVTQEAFTRAWRGLSGFRGPARFTTWLYRIVHNLCLNRLPGLRRELLQTEPLEEVLAIPIPPRPTSSTRGIGWSYGWRCCC